MDKNRDACHSGDKKKEFLTDNASFALKYFFAAMLLYACFACSRHEAELLRKVETIVEQQPDSAFRLLNTILFPEDMSESLFHKHSLLMLQAKDKSDRNITADTIIFAAKDYFARKKNFPDAAAAAFYAGRVLYEQGKAEKAIDAYNEAERLAEQTDNYNLQGLIQGNLSILYRKHFSFDESIIRGKKAIEMYIKAQNHKNEISALIVIGDCFLLKNEIDSAFRYYNKSINLAYVHQIPELQAAARQNIGVAFRKTGEYSIAKKYLNEALTFKVDSIEKARIFMNLATVYSLENKLDSAKFYIKKSLNLNIREPALSGSIYFSLSKIEEKEGNYKEALKYFKQYTQYVANQVDNNKSKALLELNEKYDFEKLKTENRELKRKRQIMIVTLVFIGSLLVFSFYRKSVRRKNMVLELNQKIETLQNMATNYRTADENTRKIILQQYAIMKKATLFKNNINDVQANDGKYLLKKLNEIIFNFDSLYKIMNLTQDGLYNNIHNHYNLDELNFRVCCLLCEGFRNQEIAVILNLTANMVEKKRTAIRKEIGIPIRGNIKDFIYKDLLEKDDKNEKIAAKKSISDFRIFVILRELLFQKRKNSRR
jgi:tetratricopeptide (TPR) repeat protein